MAQELEGKTIAILAADGLPAFCAKAVEEFTEGAQDVANAGATA
jgi:hypothetical protein